MSAPTDAPAITPVPVNEAPVATDAPVQPRAGGAVVDDDVNHWKNEFNAVLSKPSETFNSKSAPGANGWSTSLFGCFSPVDTCLITCCVPCVTFGKTHHRVNKSGDMDGYEPVNTSCLLFCGSSFFGLHWVLSALQRSEVRDKYHLEGSCLGDLARSCCCACCNLIQLDKESEHREKLLRESGQQQQYKSNADMVYPGAA
ncbi:Protein PLANT CADMIUM RESISTANCE 4 [Cladobotryum mycophilum]|uniref:Protein PLANT CADMIUM RESISTANCE 4 n=1 Tax=Cladobotryum mycophilum TaxID=491253 RepID=A0ABR0SLN7_9HYPO